MGILKAGTLRITDDPQRVSPGEKYRLYQVRQNDDEHVVASMGLTIEDFEDLRNLLEAQVEIEDFHEWVKPYMTGLQSDDTPTQ